MRRIAKTIGTYQTPDGATRWKGSAEVWSDSSEKGSCDSVHTTGTTRSEVQKQLSIWTRGKKLR